MPQHALATLVSLADGALAEPRLGSEAQGHDTTTAATEHRAAAAWHTGRGEDSSSRSRQQDHYRLQAPSRTSKRSRHQQQAPAKPSSKSLRHLRHHSSDLTQSSSGLAHRQGEDSSSHSRQQDHCRPQAPSRASKRSRHRQQAPAKPSNIRYVTSTARRPSKPAGRKPQTKPPVAGPSRSTSPASTTTVHCRRKQQ